MGATPEQKNALPKEGILSCMLDNSLPTHKVKLDDYFIGETEVTQELWDAVMDTKSSELFEDVDIYDINGFEILRVGDKYPMHNMTWYDAQEFCEKLSRLTGRRYCLPTEAQWEFAARGGKYSKKYVFSGANWGDMTDVTDTNSAPLRYVASKKANELGVYDMSGNVWEWCYDWYGEYTASKQHNPTGPRSGDSKVVRGGDSGSMYPQIQFTSYREHVEPQWRYDYNGFRIALIPEEVNSERDGYEWVTLKGDANLYGAQANGKVVVPTYYDEVKYMPYHDGYFLVWSNGFIGVYDCAGNYLIPASRGYSSILKTCSDGRYYYRVCKDGKYGACDLNGVEIVEPRYRDLILYNGVFIYRDIEDWQPLAIGIGSDNAVVRNPQFAQSTQMNYDIALEQTRLEEVFGKDVKVEQVVTDDGHRAFKIVFENQILFEFGKSTLNVQAIKYISQVAEALKKLPSTHVVVKGYTDNVGSLETNRRVSNNRAKAVSDRLALLGIARTRLSAQGVPLADYVATNETEEGRALNRRVEIVIEPMK